MIVLLFILSWAKAVEVSLEVNREIYVGVPFVLTVVVSDVDENPQPELELPEIPGAEVEFLGVSPSVSTQISIVNGRRSMVKDVNFAFRYQVTANKTGAATIAPIKGSQAGILFSGRGGRFVAQDVPSTKDLGIEVVYPERPFRVGETVPVEVHLFLRKDLNDHIFVIPLFEQRDVLSVSPGSAQGSEGSLEVEAGGDVLRLPFTKDTATKSGLQYTRFRLKAEMTLLKAATLVLDSPRIVAQLATGRSSGRGLFRRPETRLFQAIGSGRELVVQPLPLKGRPESFAGAVGSSFSLEVRADRTVVKVGEPVQLELMVRGKGELAGLQLPSLDQAGLDPDLFVMPATAPIGEDIDGGKKFAVTTRLRSASVREIPALEFAYYDSESQRYARAYSEPIALSVEGSQTISAGNVVSSAPAPVTSAQPQVLRSLSGADLSLSPVEQTLQKGLSAGTAVIIAGAGHVLTLFAALMVFLRRKGAGDRAAKKQRKQRNKALRQALESARSAPISEVAPALSAALKDWERQSAVSVRDLIGRIETEAYSPSATTDSCSEQLLRDIEARIEPAATLTSGSVAGLLLCSILLASSDAVAAGESARELYQQALTIENRSERITAFEQAEQQYRALAEQHPEASNVYLDWSSAAIGAAQLGTARAALVSAQQLSPRSTQVRQNLQWIESQLPEWVRQPARASAVKTLIFWPQFTTTAEQLLLMTVVFGLMAAVTLRRKGVLSVLALIWLSLAVSVLWSTQKTKVGVSLSEAGPMRAADNSGAPAVSDYVPAGAQLEVLRQLDGWTEVRLGSGRRGWLPMRAVKVLD